jgi:hypothetical protein
MGAPEVEDAARGGEGIVLKIQAWEFTLEFTRIVDKPSLVKEQCFISDQAPRKTFLCYSYRKASIGSRREARKAGTMPLTSPTAPRMSVDAISVPGVMIRRISPASAFLAKALYNVSLPTESATV